MRCPSCHHENRSDRRFCTQCGTELAVGCPSCGAPIETGEKFCGGCGAALTIGGRTTSPSPAHASLLAEKIRQAKATVEGERKQVTVLFVDVKGSMKLAEQFDPEAWSQIKYLAEDYRRHVRQQTRLVNQLTATLKAYYPRALEVTELKREERYDRFIRPLDRKRDQLTADVATRLRALSGRQQATPGGSWPLPRG
jgi:hypothetical protein